MYRLRKTIEVNKRASIKTTRCQECKEFKKIKICKVCGQIKPCRRPDICKRSHVFSSLSKYFGFDLSLIGSIKIYEEYDRVKNILVEDYWNNELSVPEMVDKYGHYGANNFTKLMGSLGIKRRTLSEAQSLAFKHGRISPTTDPKYKHGWHETWDNRKVFYRSSYELEYAEQLDVEKVEYYMEDLRIQYWDTQLCKTRTAIPDFYIPDGNIIVEIKSDWTYDEQNMKDKVKSYLKHGYKFKLILEKKEIQIKP